MSLCSLPRSASVSRPTGGFTSDLSTDDAVGQERWICSWAPGASDWTADVWGVPSCLCPPCNDLGSRVFLPKRCVHVCV